MTTGRKSLKNTVWIDNRERERERHGVSFFCLPTHNERLGYASIVVVVVVALDNAVLYSTTVTFHSYFFYEFLLTD